jgi:hypothetical protein
MVSVNSNLTGVVTTVAIATPSLQALASRLHHHTAQLLVVGDKRGPAACQVSGAQFLSLDAQLRLPFKLPAFLPTGHYARKNLGYLHAIAQGAACIYESDDDNAPTPGWKPRELKVNARAVKHRGWVNVYRYFTEEFIWPRGMPLDAVKANGGLPVLQNCPSVEVLAPIQQGLVDASPDVDALWRLLLGRDFRFADGPSIYLPPGTWCPFNSQSTWWWPEAYPLMYLPSFCTFRMTDIWRGFVAQRCLWAMGHGLVFHGPEVIQERNVHNLMKDFEHEIPGYLGNHRIAEILENLKLCSGPENAGGNLWKCYEALVSGGFLPAMEIELVGAWIEDVDSIQRTTAKPQNLSV